MLMVLSTTSGDRVGVNPFEIAHMTVECGNARTSVRVQMKSGVVFHIADTLDRIVASVNSATERFSSNA